MRRREPTEAQRVASHARREWFSALVKTIAAMTETERIDLAARMPVIVTCEGRVLSGHNQILLALQYPSISIVGGFQQWRKQGRCVRKGEHGLMLGIPRTRGESATDTPLENAAASPGFFMGTVFDIGQTDALDETAQAVA